MAGRALCLFMGITIGAASVFLATQISVLSFVLWAMGCGFISYHVVK